MAARKKAAKRKTARSSTKSKSQAKSVKKSASEGRRKMSLAERRRALRKRRRTIRMQKATSAITNVRILPGMASKEMPHTRTRIMRKNDKNAGLPNDKNVMIKALVAAGSVSALAEDLGTTKQAIGAWFGRRGLQAIDITQTQRDRKKEIM